MFLMDPLGNVTGYEDPYAIELQQEELRRQEEERVRREQERLRMESEKPVSQTVTVNPDGTQDVTIKGPATVLQQHATARQQERNATPLVPVSPAYLQNIAQSESGANPNIGYHFPQNAQGQRTSTAFGPFGMTDAAWADAQRRNPALAGVSKETATPDQMRAAMTSYTQQNAQALQNLGVPVNDNTLSAAHFAGAKGLHDFMTKTDEQGRPYISQAAQNANGGYDKTRAIIESRLGGQMAPASGAVLGAAPPAAVIGTTVPSNATPVTPDEFTGIDQQVAANAAQAQPQYTEAQIQAAFDEQRKQQSINSFLEAQNDPKQMLAYIANGDHPQELRSQMERTYYDTLKSKYTTAKTTDKFNNAIQSGDTRTAASMLQNKGEEGSLLRAWLYAAIGFQSGAQAEVAKMNLPGKWDRGMNQAGDTGMIQYSTSGMPLRGVKADGTQMNEQELIEYSSLGGKGVETLGTLHQAEVNGEMHTFESRKTPAGIQYRDATAGTGWTTKAPVGLSTLGHVDQRMRLADQAFKTSITADEAENRKQIAAGLKPLYTPEQMQERASGKRNAILGLGTPGVSNVPAATTPTAPTPTAPAATGQEPAPAAPAPAAPAPTAPAPAAPAPTGQALAPELEAQAQAIARGDVKMPTGMGAANRLNQAIRNRVYQINPQYDPTVYENRAKTENAFTTGKQGDVVRSMNVSIDHLDTLQTAANALNNGQIPLFNDIANKFAKNTGQPAPTDFDALKTLVGSEVAKAIQGGATALGDREEIRNEINNARSPAQLAGVINKYQHLLAGQMSGLKQQYISGGGRRWDEKINPRTNEIMTQMEREKQNAAKPGGGLPAPYQDADKERRYQEWLKKRNQGK